MIRLLLADDQALVRAGFRMVLDAQPDMSVVGEVGDGQAAVDAVSAAAAGVSGAALPDVVLMDIRMPGLDGVAATQRIVDSGVATKILVLTTFDLDEYVFASLRAGASGFLLKDAGPTELLASIRAVHRGDAVIAPSTTRRLLERFAEHLPDPAAPPAAEGHPRLSALTARELDVLTLVGRGLSNAEICDALVVAEATVKTHIGRILHKLALRDRVQMVLLAYDTGLVRPRS